MEESESEKVKKCKNAVAMSGTNENPHPRLIIVRGIGQAGMEAT